MLDLPKTNYISCLTTTETSEPAANVRRTSRGEATLVRIHEHWPSADRVELTSPKSAKCLFYKIVFLNKPQILDKLKI